MGPKDICLHGLWIVERYSQWVTNPKSIRGLEAFRRFAAGEITEEALAEVIKDTFDAVREAQEALRESQENQGSQAAALAKQQEDLEEDQACAWGQAVSQANLSMEWAKVFLAKAVQSLVERRDTVDKIGKTVANAVAELAYANAAREAAQKVLDGEKIPRNAWQIWDAAEELAFASERAAQKLEWFCLMQRGNAAN